MHVRGRHLRGARVNAFWTAAAMYSEPSDSAKADKLALEAGYEVEDWANNDLGTACGKFFRVGCLAITHAGDSDILGMITEGQ